LSLPENLLEDIRNRISLVDLVSRQVRLVRRGREHLGLCPFHTEKTPSFTVNEQKGFYHCFGCGAHGSLFDFVMQTERLSFPHAVERLAQIAGVTLPQPQAKDREHQRHRQTLFDAIEQAAAFYERTLQSPEGEAARAYLAGRGLDEAALCRFRLGYAPSGRSALRTTLAHAGISDAVMVEAGLVVQPDDQTALPYDRFRSRVIFPIADGRGRTVGFGGRLLGSGEPKYLNSPDTPLFHKGHLLYGMPAAAEAARRTGRLIVVEGYMDAIGLALAGYEETVAPLGTALTTEQLQELWRLAPAPILCFDPDTAGRRAAMRACERALPLLRPGLGLRFAFLATETGDDPDAVARRYPPQFLARAFAEAVPLSTMLVWLETAGMPPSTPEARAAAVARLKQRASAITDRSVRAQFLSAFREAVPRLRSARSDFNGRRRRSPEKPPVARGDAAVPAVGRMVAARDAEVTLLAVLCRHPGFFHEVEEEIGAVVFSDDERDRLRQALVAVLSGPDALTIAQLRGALPGDSLRATVDTVLADPIVRRHRLIAADSSIEQIRATWRENVNLLRRLLEAAEPACPKTSDITEAMLTSRFARKRASLDEQAREQTGDID
jgi:DNA primase